MSLLKQLSERPWERKGIIGPLKAEGTFKSPAEHIVLNFFLAVASILFFSLGASYYFRMDSPDWQPITESAILWTNTGLLVISSVLFQLARNYTKYGSVRKVKLLFFSGGAFAVLFILGQLRTWELLGTTGVYLTSGPAASFYFLLTGLHAIHIAGGLYAWLNCVLKMLLEEDIQPYKTNIELCTVYWHFLLIVWLVMFALLANS